MQGGNQNKFPNHRNDPCSDLCKKTGAFKMEGI